MNDILHDKRPLLDHGYLQLVEAWGSDRRIIESARQSTDKGFLGWGPTCTECGWSKGEDHEAGCSRPDTYKAGDEKLLAYLWKNKHSTPFEFAGLTVEVQAPIFVFREWHRHRVPFGYSELSARYAPMPNLNYLPTLERCKAGGGHLTKQAAAAELSNPLTDEAALDWLAGLEQLYEQSERVYQLGLKVGIPKELARLAVTVGRYSRMRATGNLRGWMAFLALRHAPTAQFEIRVFAQVIDEVLRQTFPRTMQVANG